MIRAFYTAKSGVSGYQNSLDVTSNNIANANTAAYKAQRANFTEMLYTNLQGAGDSAPQNLQAGSGVKLQETSKLLTPGETESTARTLDVAIDGDGFFAVSDGQGNIGFTRAGNFKISNENGVDYLVAQNGDYVLNGNFRRVTVAGDAESAVLQADDGTAGGSGVKLGIFTFSNPYALNLEGGGMYSQNNASGRAQLSTNASVKQYCLEGSNADLTTEMEKLIEAQRGFQFNAKIIRTADEMEEIANNLR